MLELRTAFKMRAIGGSVAPGFEPVAAAFVRNFEQRGELGAAFAVARDGELLVDLWGGLADRASARPWRAETLQILFSGGKAIVATCMLLLVERHRLDLNASVARYWPEFGAAGKRHLPVRAVLTHTARLPGLETPVTWLEATDARRMAALLAAQAPSADPRAARAYHACTFGWLCGELVRRVDGRTIGRFVAEEIAEPLGLDLWLGLPEELEGRVSTVELSDTWGAARAAAGLSDDDPLWRSVHANPPRWERDRFPWNERAWHAAEIPSSNAIGAARSIARFYAQIDRLLAAETLTLATAPASVGDDPLLGSPTAFGLGFQLQTERTPLGPPAGAFGHNGAGGSKHGRWPEWGVGFSYTPNLLREDDELGSALLGALHGCLVA
jgi:CubicO group peptidase (beta-lactamase class C family)